MVWPVTANIKHGFLWWGFTNIEVDSHMHKLQWTGKGKRNVCLSLSLSWCVLFTYFKLTANGLIKSLWHIKIQFDLWIIRWKYWQGKEKSFFKHVVVSEHNFLSNRINRGSLVDKQNTDCLRVSVFIWWWVFISHLVSEGCCYATFLLAD